MNYKTADNWKYTANKGYYFRKGDIISTCLYLGKTDSIDNWEVITTKQKEAIEAEIKARAEAELAEQAITEEVVG